MAVATTNSISNRSINELIDGIIDWKKGDLKVSSGSSIFSAEFLKLAGTPMGDWYPFAMGRYGYRDDYSAYFSAVSDYVTQRYKEPNRLDATRATEWHRIALAVSAVGGDPTAIGEHDGEPINLIADGTYNRENVGIQGINGWAWGLITLDSKGYGVPPDAIWTRDDFISKIIEQQRRDGGFALSPVSAASDPDTTALVIQALSPYINHEKRYQAQAPSGIGNVNLPTVAKTVREVIDECLDRLSKLQGEDGDYAYFGTVNAESTAWVMLAVIAAGINPLSDSRFIKNGNTLLDGIMKYRSSDGGFARMNPSDPDNPAFVAGRSNSKTSEQVLYALVGLYRYQNNMNNLFDLRDAPEGLTPAGKKPDLLLILTLSIAGGVAAATGIAFASLKIYHKKRTTVP
jgi:hypothetical protein